MGLKALYMLGGNVLLFVGVGLVALLAGKCNWLEFGAFVGLATGPFYLYLQVRPDNRIPPAGGE